MYSLPVIEWSKIQKKNEMQKFLTFHYFGRAADEVLAVCGIFAAEPACAAFLEGLEKEVGFALEAEAVADGQLVEGEAVGVVVGIVVVQQTFYLLGHGTRQRDATRVFSEKWLEVRGEEVGVGDKQLAVFLLPLMTMGRR